MSNSLTAPNILQNLFFQISSYSGACVRILYDKTKGQIHWESKTYWLKKSISHDSK